MPPLWQYLGCREKRRPTSSFRPPKGVGPRHPNAMCARIARGDLSEEIGRLKREPGNDLIAHGGATFDQALSRLGLVDKYRLMIQPARLGSGLSLFKDLAAPLHLELVEATTYASGVAIHVCRPRSTPVG
jgi:dihydrofolate reductase